MDRLFVGLVSASSLGAYAAVFGTLLVCGLGVPLPEDIPLIAAGYLSWRGTMALPIAFVTTMLGVLVGDTILFFIGRRVGAALLGTPFVESFLPKRRQRRVRAYFRRFGDRVVFFARFVVGIRGAVFFVAGATGVPYRRFLLFDGLAALLSVPVWLGLGYGLGVYVGNEVEKVLEAMERFRGIALGVTIVAAAILVVPPIVRLVRAARLAKKAAQVRSPAS